MKKAHEQGRAEGIDKIASNMLKEGEHCAKISRLTGLSMEALARLKDKLST